MSLPIVDIFSKPFYAWASRKATQQEMLEYYHSHGHFISTVKDYLITILVDHVDAASYTANKGVANELESYIDDFLDKSTEYKLFRSKMPSKTPSVFFDYQQKYPNYNKADLDREINSIGHTLSDGQCLFHGGFLPESSKPIFLSRPLSTSFCPQVALRNSEWKGKAYDANQIDLLVLRAVAPKTNVFGFPRAGTKMGNEKEVLFASGAKLVVRNRKVIKESYTVSKYGFKNKDVPIYVVEADIS